MASTSMMTLTLIDADDDIDANNGIDANDDIDANDFINADDDIDTDDDDDIAKMMKLTMMTSTMKMTLVTE